jgi:septal ring factor EnvC (AmiA/AmiB activator)
LLSGDNPQELGRNLGYLGYVSSARVQSVQSLKTELDRLAALQTQADARRTDIARTVAETTKQKTELESQQSERATLLAQLEGQIAAQRAEARQLGQDDSRLSTLIGDLEKAIAEQAEASRLAEAARQRELAARQAQEAKLAQEAQAKALAERQAATARAEAAAKAEAAAAAAAQTAKNEAARLAAQAERDKAEQAAMLAREQVEAARERERQADQRARSAIALGDFGALRPADQGSVRVVQPSPAVRIEPAPTPPAPAPATVARVAPVDEGASRAQQEAGEAQTASPPPARRATAVAGGGNGLRHGLPPPVRGAVQGRFGVDRPDGGVWRGIVLRTDAGTPVKAIAPGTVVYASWLRGFGNLIIVDHGKQYMSVYAYNQSLLKQVGDAIAAGDVVATVGSTGGQVESGLYFEIRYRGTPVDPTQWLAL